ncbi:MAG: hypothetical protein JSS10_02390 [Verrucomicrobia bacterium]|nr:hypothetical protein [Verrucomicrobiota bacterium]
MKHPSTLLFSSLAVFILLLAKVDRLNLKAAHGFCLHAVDVPLTPNLSWQTLEPFPTKILEQTFTYLDKGAQNFVFESEDQNYVLKFYRFPSRLRQFSFVSHPFSFLVPSKTAEAKSYSERRVQFSYNSYFLASRYLKQETGVIYVHLNPTPDLDPKVRLKDRAGHFYELPLANIGFVLQKKGQPFLPLLKSRIQHQQIHLAEQMIDSLIHLIVSRCSRGITDLDNMANDNYGWAEDHAVHLDIGRFVPHEEMKKISVYRQEVIRVTSPLARYLKKNSPELSQYYEQQISKIGA